MNYKKKFIELTYSDENGRQETIWTELIKRDKNFIYVKNDYNTDGEIRQHFKYWIPIKSIHFVKELEEWFFRQNKERRKARGGK